ncbi:MarR family transcriptional regulator [Altererythrobacter salegens]|uniref:MarR family transcriptional regulator n=1 Tax=Croceibacterium salegens TaxID=1737568 RepID=A0A6I4SXS6_9SPHN|nr:MarR family transcriptional regulator [Croceibacterium salegens]MXO59940.1 MarR family transcriptional regulator [Croceibacterium salegens]
MIPKVWHLFGKDHQPYRLLLLARMIDRETQKALDKRFGLSLAEWRLLAIATSIGPCTASEIGQAGEIDRAEISRALVKLERAGLIFRKQDPNHGKKLIITPTREGLRLANRVKAERRRFFEAMMSGMTREERSELDRQLLVMANNLLSSSNSAG